MGPKKRKDNILNCAKRLFSKNGFYQTQISDIIKEANIARGTVYRYFKNKDDILITLLSNFYLEWETSVSIELTGIDLQTIEPVDYFRHRVKQTLVFMSNDRDLCNIVLRMGLGLGGEFESIINRFEKKILNIISNDLKLGILNNNVRKSINTELTSNLLGGSLLGVAYHYFVKKSSRKGKPDIDKITDEIVNIFAPGIFI